jgi:hypothetical protein
MTTSLRAASSRITSDWRSYYSEFTAVRKLHLLRRCGPMLIGIILERSSPGDEYLPCSHVHNLLVPSETISLMLRKPLLTTRTGAPDTIAVRRHDAVWREAAARLENQALLPLRGAITVKRVIDAYRSARALGEDEALSIASLSEQIALARWCGDEAVVGDVLRDVSRQLSIVARSGLLNEPVETWLAAALQGAPGQHADALCDAHAEMLGLGDVRNEGLPVN